MEIVEKLIAQQQLSQTEYCHLLSCREDETVIKRLREEAFRLRRLYFGDTVYVRGLIEFTNICRNDCYYCGIRRGNNQVSRYRLSQEEILSCCGQGYALGYRTFVLQGGEDGYYTDDRLVSLIGEIKSRYPDCALTLSIGERSAQSYQRLRQAGVDRYLLRHETISPEHYALLHPATMAWENRMNCLRVLKELGYQVGAGFMVGSPGQTLEMLADELVFLQEFRPQMVGIGPFIPHHETRYAGEAAGSVELTLFLLSVIRILLPNALIPATTALGTLAHDGRERGVLAGANVVMPNLSPVANRKQYELYDNKICTGEESAQCRDCLEMRMKKIGFRVVSHRGDAPGRMDTGKEPR